LTSAVCDWEGLPGRGWHQAFDAVFCVGNSLTHAEGTAGRRKALAAMASVLRASGLLVLTSRNWELVRRAGSGLRVGNRLVERGGVPGLPIRGWTIPSGWDEPHFLDVAVARLHGAEVTTWGERLTFWPFRHGQLDDDVRSAGLVPLSSTYSPDSDRYMVTAARRG
jgi:hypothetical protein